MEHIEFLSGFPPLKILLRYLSLCLNLYLNSLALGLIDNYISFIYILYIVLFYQKIALKAIILSEAKWTLF